MWGHVMSNRFWIIAACAVLGTSVAPAMASEMVYHPVNPTFGGNPLNGAPLLSQAQAQGEGVKSGSQGPDLSGLEQALSGLVIIGGNGSGNGNGGNGNGNGNGGSGNGSSNGIVP